MFKPDKSDYEHPRTFKEELDHQCNALVVPASLLLMFAWTPFILLELDKKLSSDLDVIIGLRWGLSLVGVLSLILHFTPFFKKRGYWLIVFIAGYVGLATGLIVGLTGANPVYMGGFSIVVFLIILPPLQRSHSLIILISSVVLFMIVGSRKMSFREADELYGLLNLVISMAISVVAILVFDKIRKGSYEKSRLIKRANEELQKANELKNELLQIAAHDLKDPLQVIIGYTDLLQMKLKGNKFAVEKLKIVYRSSDRMIKLIGGLLEIASIESGNMQLHKSEVDLGQVAEASVKSHRQASEKKNQKLHYTLEETCIIDGDRMLLRQIVNNLISNAIKFSPPCKSIWVTVSRDNGFAVFEVRDEGPGLQEDEKKRLFDKFQQLSPKPTAGEISTGLGLAITKDLVELHNGKIIVESEPGKGSTFVVHLPLLEKTSDRDT